jgi:uncharacterized membrane protein YbaN (DUF454 family)
MSSQTNPSPTSPLDDATAKLIACVIILACLAIGLAGLILPLIPGLLFLGIAALVAARHSPALERVFRGNATLSGYMDSTEGFLDLPLGKKVQIGGWLCLKMLIDAVAYVVAAVAKLMGQLSAR